MAPSPRLPPTWATLRRTTLRLTRRRTSVGTYATLHLKDGIVSGAKEAALPAVSVDRTSTQAIAGNTLTPVNFNEDGFPTVAGMHSTATNPDGSSRLSAASIR